MWDFIKSFFLQSTPVQTKVDYIAEGGDCRLDNCVGCSRDCWSQVSGGYADEPKKEEESNGDTK